MKINKLGFLSFLSFLGLFGVITGKNELLGFWGFAVYFRYFFVKPDELFVENVRKAASIGFFSGIAATAICIVIHMLSPTLISSHMALASCFIVSIVFFTIVLVTLEVKEMGME